MMFSYRAFRLYIGHSLIGLVSKGNLQCYRLCHPINLYQPHVKKMGSCRRSVKYFLPNDRFRTNSYSRHLISNKQCSTDFNAVKLMTLSGILSLFYGKEEDKDTELITMIKRGILSIQKEDYKVAEKILHVALKLAQDQQNADGITYIYDLLANVAFELAEWEKAEKLFVNVMQRELARGTPKDDMKILHMSLKLAKIYESINDDEKAEQGFQFCMENLEKRLNKNLEDEDVQSLWAMTLDWYARFLQQRNRMQEALVYYKRSYDMCVNVNGEIHEQNVILLNDIGTVTFLKGDKEGAIEYMNKAIEIGKHLPNMEDFSSVYVNLGNIYLQKGMYQEAKKSCTEGLQNATRHNNPEGLKEANVCLEEIKKLYRH